MDIHLAWLSARVKKKKSVYLLPNVLLVEHTGQITAPVASRPPSTLLQELGVVFQGGLNFGFRVVLHEGLPAVRHHPTGNKVVIVRIQLVFAKPPFLVGERVGEHLILKDLGAICNTASGHARKATIHVRRSCTFKVASLQVQSSQEIVNALRERRGSCPAQSLTGDHTTVSLVLFKRSQNPRHSSTWPADIVIRKHGDRRANFWNGPSHLTPLVGVGDCKETDSRLGGGHSTQHALGLLLVGLDGDQQELIGPVFENCSDGLDQFITTTLQCRYDHRDILRSQFRVLGRRDGLEGPEGDEVHH